MVKFKNYIEEDEMSKVTLIDSHCHLNSEQLENDIEEIIEESKKYGVKYIVVAGYSLESSIKAVEIANNYDNVYCLIGLHPDEATNYTDEDLEKIKELALNNKEKVVAIGEIGLDYYWHKEENVHELQKELFIKQINLANELDLPINIHTREATLDTIKILQENTVNKRGIMHCCPINGHLVKETVKLGYYISFAGVITFKNAKAEEVINLVPNDKILCETDSPYLAPEPTRGKTNIPGYSYYTAKKIADTKNIDFIEFSNILLENTRRIYNREFK